MTALLVLQGPVAALPQTLDSLARQTRAPERLVVVDLGQDGNAVEAVRSHEALAAAIPSLRFLTVHGATTLSSAVSRALSLLSDADVLDGVASSIPDGAIDHLWVLTCDSAAAPTTLARLLDAVRRSPSVGVAGPKLLDWNRPGRLRAVGTQVTRTGRLIPSPLPGEPDQGQYDRRTDVLAVPTTGMLVERHLVEELGGPDHALGQLGGEIDFGWRAQLAGRRVVVVPRATVRTNALRSAVDTQHEADTQPEGDTPDGADLRVDSLRRQRREARRAALVRCSVLTLPFLALWIALSSVVAGLGLLVAKRPRAAWAEFSDIGAVLTPIRVIGARWRSRGTRQVRRRDLAGLFVGVRTVLRHAGDLIHDQVALESRTSPGDDELAPTPVESGPVADEAEDLNILGSTWASRAARNPGLLAVAAATIVSTVASRDLGGSVVQRFQQGIAGGELIGVRATPGSLWHLWLDGWHGTGLGQSGEQGPHLVVLAGLAWVVSHLPIVGVPSSPAGAVLAVLTGLALPLATMTAYLAARVVTRSRWPRALGALAWSTSAILTTAVADGRLGGVVAAILLPLVAAGIALCARREASATATAATVLVTALTAAFVPALGVAAMAAGLLVMLLGHGAARLRGLALAVGPVVLLGPWVADLVARPALLLTGPGLSVWGTDQAAPWQLALLHPGGPASTPLVLSAPLVLAGVLGLLRTGRGKASWALAALAALGLAAALAAPRIHLGTVPSGTPHQGAPITAWAGTGLLAMMLALLAAALLGSQGLPVRQTSGGWLALARWPVAVAVLAAVLLSAGWTAWHTVGDTLHAWTDPRPAVAIDQAEGPLSNRMLLLEPDDAGLAYRLIGREPSDVARTLPPPARAAADQTDQEALATAVSALFEQGAAPGELHPSRDLSALAVGFVGLRTDPSDPRIRELDATAGLSRLGDHDGVIFWRVLAGGGTDDALAPSRARVVAAGAESAAPVDGDHSRLHATVVAPAGASLVLAEPRGWTLHARVSANGHVLAPQGGTAAYPLPRGTSDVSVQVLPTDTLWRYAQGLAVLLTLFIAIPLGTRASRRRS